jgi:hypothetical protein
MNASSSCRCRTETVWGLATLDGRDPGTGEPGVTGAGRTRRSRRRRPRRQGAGEQGPDRAGQLGDANLAAILCRWAGPSERRQGTENVWRPALASDFYFFF